MASDRTDVSLRDLFYELSSDLENPTPGLLRKLINDHPQHAATLSQFAEELELDDDAEPNEDDVPDERVDQLVAPAMSRFQDRLYRLTQAAAAPSVSVTEAKGTSDPFAGLGVKDLREIAAVLEVNSLFLRKVCDREIKAATIPQRFSERLAEKLRVPVSEFITYQALPPRMEPTVRYRSETKPSAGAQQSWEEAVRSSNLTPEQQAALLSM